MAYKAHLSHPVSESLHLCSCAHVYSHVCMYVLLKHTTYQYILFYQQ